MAPSKLTTESRHAAFLLLHNVQGLLTKLEEKVYTADAGISYPQFLVLITVASSEPPVSQTTIARRIQRELNSISMIVDRMEKLKLVTKTRSEVDRRETHVALTPLGKRKLAKAIEIGGALRERLGGVFTEGELEEAIRLTTKLRNQILKELGLKPAPAQEDKAIRQRVIEVFKRGGAP